MDKPKVYIVDDSLMFRAMLETMVSREPAFEICGIATNADEAVAEVGWLLPDIILLDLNFRVGMSGLAFLDAIEGHWHAMNIIIVSADARRETEICDRAFARGAVACFDKAQVMTSGRELIALMYDLAGVGPEQWPVWKPALARSFSRAITLPGLRH